jgi:ribosomal protein S18 acetylase RimI-like enzyme
MDFQVLQAESKDSSAIASLFNEYRMFYEQDSNIDLALSFIQARLLSKESVIFYAVSSSSSDYLGFTQLYPSFSSVSAQRTWILNDLYVCEAARKQGVARALMLKARDFAISQQAKSISLMTARDNVNAQALYESLGFVRDQQFYSYSLSLK